MDNRRFTLFLILSLIIHFVVLFVIKMEPVEPKKKRTTTVIDLLDKKKIKTPPKTKPPKSELLAEKDIDLKKKTEPKKTIPQKSQTEKKVVIPTPPVIKKEVVKKTPPKNPKKKVVKDKIPVKKEDVKKKKDTRPEKVVEKEEIEPPKKQIRSLADLNTRDVVDTFTTEKPVTRNEGDDTVNLQAVGFKYASYFSKFRRHVENNWNYPRQSAMRGEQGSVMVRFSILKDGTITDVNTIGSSGYPDLDREVLRLLNTIKGFPLPKSWQKDRLKIEGKFLYQLYGNGIRGSFE